MSLAKRSRSIIGTVAASVIRRYAKDIITALLLAPCLNMTNNNGNWLSAFARDRFVLSNRPPTALFSNIYQHTSPCLHPAPDAKPARKVGNFATFRRTFSGSASKTSHAAEHNKRDRGGDGTEPSICRALVGSENADCARKGCSGEG